MPGSSGPGIVRCMRDGQSAEAVQILDDLIAEAVRSGASDIHLEPKEHRLAVRFRVDGVLVNRRPYPVDKASGVLARVKVLGKMDLAERRLPQDGTFEVSVQGRTISLRCSSFPTPYGEKMVLRLLPGGYSRPLARLGMLEDQVEVLARWVGQTSGLVLVTGPTGSGKTSTLYSCLGALDAKSRNVVTLEDPIEVNLPEITQGQVNVRIGMDFARGLRHVLRQDPDVILVGEMRDLETAQIAVRASLTGHLVLSTLHTTSSVATIVRLLDMGLERHVVAGALTGIVAQRLVRRLCPGCQSVGRPERDWSKDFGFQVAPDALLPKAVGCPRCLHTGYRGRAGIFDVVEVDDDLRDLVRSGASRRELKELLKDRELPTVRRRGVELVQQGVTTLSEVLRVT